MTFDILIVGGGPAGATMAARTSRAGLSVALADPMTPRPLTQRVETVFVRPTADDHARDFLRYLCASGATPISTYETSWGEKNPDTFGAHTQMVMVDRERLDRRLIESASAGGAVIFQGTIHRIERAGLSWIAQTSWGHEVRARVIADATGRKAQFARRWGAKLGIADKLVARCAASAVGREGHTPGLALKPHAYGWTVALTTRDGACSIATVCDLQGGSRLFAEQSDDARALFCPAADVVTRLAGPQALDRAVLSRIIAIGDAAQALDPLSGRGISTAIADGASAASAILSAFDGDPSQLVRHEDQRRASFVKHLQTRTKFYLAEQRWAKEPFWQRRHAPISLPNVLEHWLDDTASSARPDL